MAEPRVEHWAEDTGVGGGGASAYNPRRASEKHEGRAIHRQGAARDGAVVVMSAHDDVIVAVTVDIASPRHAPTEFAGSLVPQQHRVGRGGVGAHDPAGTAEKNENGALVKQPVDSVPTEGANDNVGVTVTVDVPRVGDGRTEVRRGEVP